MHLLINNIAHILPTCLPCNHLLPTSNLSINYLLTTCPSTYLPIYFATICLPTYLHVYLLTYLPTNCIPDNEVNLRGYMPTHQLNTSNLLNNIKNDLNISNVTHVTLYLEQLTLVIIFYGPTPCRHHTF